MHGISIKDYPDLSYRIPRGSAGAIQAGAKHVGVVFMRKRGQISEEEPVL